MNRKNPFVRILLSPFATIYLFATWLRNQFFDWRLLPSTKFPIPVICIGNIAVGGTGKTPFTEYLIALLRKQYRVATLSRGYKRDTKGFILVDANNTASEAGDEACQVKRKFPDIIVAVDGNRRRGIKKLLSLPAEGRPNVIILDDAMQHRYVTPSMTIMLTDYNNLYFEDFVLPAGNLRESVKGAYRADIIIVTKCKDDIKPIDLRIIEKNMMLMANQNLYFSKIKYHTLEPLFPSLALHPCTLNEIEANEDLLLIAGIAEPQPLIDISTKLNDHKLKALNPRIKVFKFKDHHHFTPADIQCIDAGFQKMSAKKKRIITTEKDAVRLKSLPFLPENWKPFLYVLPVSIDFLYEQAEIFDAKVRTHVISTINIYKKNARN